MRRLRIAAATLAMLAACRPAPRTLPKLPQVAVERFAAAGQEQLRKAYEEARAKPSDAGANGRLGMVLHAYEQYDAAAPCYARARMLDPQQLPWVYLLGTVQAMAGRNAEAAASLREALRRDPDYLPAQVKLADVLLALGRLRESQQLYEALAARYPQLAQAHYGVGRARAAQGDAAAALDPYRKACELTPVFGAARYGLAQAYQKLGETAKAREELALYRKDPLGGPVVPDRLLDQVKALNQGAVYHLKKGVSLEAAGRVQESIAEHEQALALDSRLTQAHVNLITLYGQAGDASRVESHYRAAVEQNPNLAEAYYNYGVFQFGRQRYREATQAFTQALAINPNFPQAHGNLGYMRMLEGRLDRAMEHYRAALQHQPNYWLAHFQLGRLLLNRGRTEEAIVHLRQAATAEDDNAAGYLYALSAAYARAGQRQLAVEYGRRARDRAAAAGQTALAGSISRDLRLLEGK